MYEITSPDPSSFFPFVLFKIAYITILRR